MTEKNLLAYFWDLASTNEAARVDAALSLIRHLRSRKKDQDCSDETTDDLNYTLKRLVKGLASSRKAARQGFAMALTEIILIFESVTVNEIIEIMNESLVVSKSCSTQEERDVYIGQIFGLFTLGRAICLANKHNNSRLDISSLKLIVERLKELSKKKSYLEETCYKAIVDLLSMLDFQDFQQHILSVLENDLKCNSEACSPECLFLVLTVWRLYKVDMGIKYFKKSWSSPHLDAVKNYPALARILQNSHSSHPRVHIVWDEVLLMVTTSDRTDVKKFWLTVVDENLFQSSHERKFLGFKVLEKILPLLSTHQVDTVFSPQLMHCLFNSLGHNTNYLYPATKQTIEGIGNKILSEEKRELVPAIIKALLTRNGNICFDAVTKTKTIENLIPKMRLVDLPDFVSWLRNLFVVGATNVEETDDSHTQSHVDNVREGVLGVFHSLIKCKELEHTTSWVLAAVNFVFKNAFFVQTIEVELSGRMRSLCQQRFNGILGELASTTMICQDEKHRGISSSVNVRHKSYGYAEDGRLWISYIMEYAQELLKNNANQLVQDITWNNEVRQVFKKATKIARKLETKNGVQTPENNAFTLMFLYVGVQLFSDAKQAKEILEELFHCYDKVKAEAITKSQDGEPHWMDVVTEILLSLLTESSHLRRQVVDQVFNIIVPYLTSSAVKIIMEAVDPRNGLDEESGLQIEDNDDNVEDLDSNDEKDEESEEDEEIEESDEDDSSDDDDARDPVDPLFKIDLQAALGNALANDKENKSDASQSDSDLDDDAMMKFDEALTEVFKQHLRAKKGEKKVKDAKKTLLHFKMRVLDLVEIIIKKCPDSELILELIQPLLEIIRTCLNSKDFTSLGERTQGIFKNKLCSVKEHPQLSLSYTEKVHINIEMLLKQVIKSSSVTMVTLISSGCLFLIRQLRGGKEENRLKGKDKEMNHDKAHSEFVHLDKTRVTLAYGEALKDFMIRRNTHLHPLLFQELINRYPFVGWNLAEDLVVYMTKGINNFRKIQACTMLSQLLTRKAYCRTNQIKIIAKPLQDTFHSVFTQSEVDMKAKHLRQIIKLASQFVKTLKSEPDLSSLLEANRMVDDLNVVVHSSTVVRANDLKNLIKLLKNNIE